MKQKDQALAHKFMALLLAPTILATAAAGPDDNIEISGSSTVYLITEAVTEEFHAVKGNDIRISIRVSGTTAGFIHFCRGELDIQNASRPILKDEMATCKKNGVSYYELPIGFDATAIVVHPSNTWLTSVTLSELKSMWEPTAQDKVKTWNQVNSQWPSRPLKLYGPGGDSGTFDYFTEAVVGQPRASRRDYEGSEDDMKIVEGVANDKDALAYVPLAYYEQNKHRLKLVAVQGGTKAPKKEAVLPSKETVIDGSYYPLARPLFIYVAAKQSEKPLVRDFVEFYLKEAPKLVSEVKYVSLTPAVYEMATRRFREKQLGTGYQGEAPVGLHINDLLARPPTL